MTDTDTAATKPYHRRIAVVFDFDLTLAPDSFNALLARCGVDPEPWRKEHVQPLIEGGWDEILAYFFCLIRLSCSGRGPRITRELVEEAGRGIEPYDGVPEMFDRLRRAARAVLPEIEVEFYLLSSGFIDVQRATRFAQHFDAILNTVGHVVKGKPHAIRMALTCLFAEGPLLLDGDQRRGRGRFRQR